MLLKHSPTEITFRKENFKIRHLYYYCTTSAEEFTTTDLDEVNLAQVHNQYRAKHNLPFVEEMKEIRAKYGLSAPKMSEVLGFGTNSYRNYENGEVPSKSNGTTIALISEPKAFRAVVERYLGFEEKKKLRLLARIDDLISEAELKKHEHCIENYVMTVGTPSVYSGFLKPNLAKFAEMVAFFASKVKPMKTKLNKLLFYSDFYTYCHTGYSMSGMKYRAIQRGPVPSKFHSIFEYLVANGVCAIRDINFGDDIVGEQFVAIPDRKFRRELFSDTELDILERIAAKFETYSSRAIVEISHLEKGWLENKDTRNLISYDYAFDLLRPAL